VSRAESGWREAVYSSVLAAVITSFEPVVPTRGEILLSQATGAPAKPCLLITMQMFEM